MVGSPRLLPPMPYQIVFEKTFAVSQIDDYLNPSCWGGDVVARRLLPAIEASYRDVQCNQEDWGWFIWCRDGAVQLAIDIFCDDPDAGRFRLHLVRKIRHWVSSRVVDGPELEQLRERVVAQLDAWHVMHLTTSRLDNQLRAVEWT